MNWDAVGAVAEVVGALGVIISLVYLALQIRQSNSTDKLTATLSLQESYNQVGDIFLREGSYLSAGLQDFSSLDIEGQLKFAVTYHLFFGHMELIYGHDQRGVVDADLTNRMYATLRTHYEFPGVAQWWELRGKHGFSNAFVAFVENGCKTT